MGIPAFLGVLGSPVHFLKPGVDAFAGCGIAHLYPVAVHDHGLVVIEKMDGVGFV